MHPPVPDGPDVRLERSRGFSLLEALLGGTLLVMLVLGAHRLSRNSIRSNALGQELSKASNVLKDFVEEARELNLDSIPRNREQSELSGEYRIRWIAYDHASPAPYTQPRDLVLLCVRVNYHSEGRDHQVETSTLLGRP
jgi:hypothetical protein